MGKSPGFSPEKVWLLLSLKPNHGGSLLEASRETTPDFMVSGRTLSPSPSDRDATLRVGERTALTLEEEPFLTRHKGKDGGRNLRFREERLDE